MPPRILKSRVGLMSIIALTILPIILWIVMRPLWMRFADPFFALTSIGQITALIGVTLFALTLILSARFHFLEEYFGGLDKMYNIHHISGVIAFTFLVIHPLILAIRLIPISVVESLKLLIPGGDWILNFGIFSLLLMMSLLTITFFAKWRYQYLRFAHQILGGAFFLGALHTYLIPSDISQNILLRIYIIGLVTLAITAYLYRTVFGRILVKKYIYIIEAVNDLGQDITELVMRSEGKVMHYKPGQFLYVTFIDGGIDNEAHPVSISSAPTEDILRITFKMLGDWSSSLKNINVGSIAKIEGPFGSFSYLRSMYKKQIWIAGGIGVTPFLSMLRNMKVNNRKDLNIDFYYATKTANEMVFRDEIQQISENNPNIRLIPYISDEKGYLNVGAIKELSGDITDTDIFICGPPPMMYSLTNQFEIEKIPKNLIHIESFKLL